jgi:accessory gene regulator protein AgrB
MVVICLLKLSGEILFNNIMKLQVNYCLGMYETQFKITIQIEGHILSC